MQEITHFYDNIAFFIAPKCDDWLGDGKHSFSPPQSHLGRPCYEYIHVCTVVILSAQSITLSVPEEEEQDEQEAE